MQRRARLWLSCGGCLVLALLGAGVAAVLFLLLAPPVGCRIAATFRETSDAAAVAPGRFVQADGLAVHVMEWGPGDGPVVLLVPGTSAWSGTWVELAEPLAASGLRVVAMDLPPFGYSERPADGDYSAGAQGRRILGVLDALGARDAVLVGHSFGGGATLQAALDAPPGQLRQVVLLDPALGLGAPDSPLAPVARVGPVRDALVAMTFTNPAFLPIGVRSMIADPADATETRVGRYAAPLEVRGTTAAIGRWLPELLAPAPARCRDPAAIETLATPTLLVWGAQDTVTPLAQGEALAALLPHGTLVAVAGVGHIPQLEDPDTVAELVLSVIAPPAPAP